MAATGTASAIKVGIIGLGVVGRRFLTLMQAHPDFVVSAIFDSNSDVRASLSAQHPAVTAMGSAEAILAASDIDLIYIAVPPAFHHDYAMAAMTAGKVVLCEKPLAIDLAQGRALAETAERLDARHAVNFVYGSARAADLLEERIAQGELGAIKGMRIDLHFAEWPRGWQASATWLAERAQGGFLREVGSHFLYLADRLFGAPKLIAGHAKFPSAHIAETHAVALFECGSVPLVLSGSVGGKGPDTVQCEVRGERRSYRISEWYKLAVSDGGPFIAEFDDFPALAQEAYRCQLDRLAGLVRGQPVKLPDFRAALRVQEAIESLLKL